MDFSNDSEVIDSFKNETAEHLDKIELFLLEIEKHTSIKDQEIIHTVFRSAHTIKAGANLLNFFEIEKSAHKIENFLDLLRRNKKLSVNKDFNTLFLEIDKIRDILDKINF